MNIQISQISNGWVVTVVDPRRGQASNYCANKDEVIACVTAIINTPINSPSRPPQVDESGD